MKKKTIGKSLLICCFVFGLLLSCAVGSMGYAVYRNNVFEESQKYITGMMEYIMQSADQDGLGEAIEAATWNEACEDMKNELDRIKDSHDIQFIYVVKPLNTKMKDNMQYVMIGQDEEERTNKEDVLFGILTGEEYSPEVVQHYLDRMDGTEDITYFANKTEWGYMYSGLKPIVDSNGKTVAILSIDVSVDKLNEMLGYYVLFVAIGSLILTGLFIGITYIWLRRRVVLPLKKIENAAEKFVELSEKDTEPEKLIFQCPEIHTQDELESLSNEINVMATNIREYMVRFLSMAKEKERIDAELEVACTIQSSHLPKIFLKPPQTLQFEMYATMDPAKEVGGDFYDFFYIDEKHFAMVIADVSGKGVGAALFMMISKTLIKNQALKSKEISPEEILTVVNKQLCDNNEADMFVTVWLGILDVETGVVKAANAGHEYPAIYRKGGKFELFKDKHGMVLGGMEISKYKEYEFKLNKGDILYVYTDGVAEATNSENELYGTDRMIEALNQTIDLEPKEILLEVRKDIDRFVKQAPQFDDITMMTLRFLG